MKVEFNGGKWKWTNECEEMFKFNLECGIEIGDFLVFFYKVICKKKN